MNDVQIVALHGFLGSVSDWSFFNLPLKPIDIFQVNPLPDLSTLNGFGKSLNQSFADHGHVLLGYSMGGRLALHALIDSPNKWKAAVIISANPGLSSEAEKKKRLSDDQALLKRFEDEDFQVVMKDWNNQDLFLKAKSSCKKIQKDIKAIKQSLTGWSLGGQDNLRQSISMLPMPILWIVGDLDKKYKALSQELTFLHPKSRVWVAENSAHRVAWDVRLEFERQVKFFLEDL